MRKYKIVTTLLDERQKEEFKERFKQVYEYEKELEIYKKVLDIAIKEIVVNLKGSDACGSYDEQYTGVKNWLIEQAKEEIEK